MSDRREFGDYQTPLDFAQKVCLYLKDKKGITPTAILEPTCGVGNLLKSSLIFGADELVGIEINPEYCAHCQESVTDPRVRVVNQSIFGSKTRSLFNNPQHCLVIGNPPWVTNSTLSALSSDNLPTKKNIKGLRGIDAITGSSNFDICEYIISHLIHEYQDTDTTIAMLCKTAVARNIFVELKRSNIGFHEFEVLEFDASKVFNISASACLLVIALGKTNNSPDICHVRNFDDVDHVISSFGYKNGQLYSDTSCLPYDFEGTSCFEWRQGVKHDCSKVMELTWRGDSLVNGRSELVDIERQLVYPLIKSSMFKKPIINSFSKYVIVTQRKAKDPTNHLEFEVPKTWAYLQQHLDDFHKRKSSIYANAPEFSMFGVGDYSYAPYKVGVSGFYKTPLFSVLYADDGSPVMTDDTSYFICFEHFDTAYVAMLLLNSTPVQAFLKTIAFLDAKRPYTKKILTRLDFRKMVDTLTLADLKLTEEQLSLDAYVTKPMYRAFQELVHNAMRSITPP